MVALQLEFQLLLHPLGISLSLNCTFIVCEDVQPPNALLPMLVTLFGIVILVKPVHL